MADPVTPLSLLEACWRDLLLGVVQGLTEFLPISSTAHLKAVPVLLGWGDPGVSVTAAIQLGSIVAVIAYFRVDLLQVFRGISRAVRHGQWREPDARLGLAMALGTVPILVIGLGIKVFWDAGYESSPLRSVPSIAIVSIVMAVLLALAERWFGDAVATPVEGMAVCRGCRQGRGCAEHRGAGGVVLPGAQQQMPAGRGSGAVQPPPGHATSIPASLCAARRGSVYARQDKGDRRGGRVRHGGHQGQPGQAAGAARTTLSEEW